MNHFSVWQKNVVSFDVLYKITCIKNSYQNFTIKSVHLSFFSKSVIADQKMIIYFLILLKLISGQESIPLKSSKSISTLKLRKGMLIGSKVEMHGCKAMSFLWLLTQLSADRSNLTIKKRLSQNVNNTKSVCLHLTNLFILPPLHFFYDKFPGTLKICLHINIHLKSNLFIVYPSFYTLFLTAF